MFNVFQSSAIDLSWNVGHVDEVDVCDFILCAAPPFTTRQHVAVDQDMPRSDVLMNAEEADVLQKGHVLSVVAGVVRS